MTLYGHSGAPWSLEPHYSAHVSAMTSEGLHSKSDIASELAFRDKEIARLRAELAENEKLRVERETLLVARHANDWNEDDGPVLWWKFPITEPPYCGTPLDDRWPDYVTHWTPTPLPKEPTQDAELLRLCDEADEEIRDAGLSQDDTYPDAAENVALREELTGLREQVIKDVKTMLDGLKLQDTLRADVARLRAELATAATVLRKWAKYPEFIPNRETDDGGDCYRTKAMLATIDAALAATEPKP